jgi:TRAP-type C4-dicarboxylate transport system substrate-binding protein
MKQRILLSALVVLFCLGFASSGFSQAPVIKLKYSTYFVATHQLSVLNQQFCDEIKKRTNGRVEIVFHPSGTLLTAPKTYQGIVSGIADIGMSNISYTRGRFPVIELLDLPLGFPSAYVATHVANDFYNKFKPKDFDNVKVLFLHGCPPYVIYTAKKPVRTLEDMKGLKIAGKGRIADILKSLGAAPVPLETGDYYESLKRGVVDGAASPINTLKDWKLGEVAKYSTSTQKLGAVYTFFVVMNKDKWNSLPADIKKIFDEVSAEYMEKMGIAWTSAAKGGEEFLLKQGGQIITLPDQESAKWQKAVEPVITSYTKEMESLGHKKSETDGYISFINERIDYWSKKEKEMVPK